jgi:hypothetical protein
MQGRGVGTTGGRPLGNIGGNRPDDIGRFRNAGCITAMHPSGRGIYAIKLGGKIAAVDLVVLLAGCGTNERERTTGVPPQVRPPVPGLARLAARLGWPVAARAPSPARQPSHRISIWAGRCSPIRRPVCRPRTARWRRLKPTRSDPGLIRQGPAPSGGTAQAPARSHKPGAHTDRPSRCRPRRWNSYRQGRSVSDLRQRRPRRLSGCRPRFPRCRCAPSPRRQC